MGAFGGAGGLHVRGHLFCVLARYAVSFRAGVHRDAGMVPLSLQVTAKGENKTTQLAALRQSVVLFSTQSPAG